MLVTLASLLLATAQGPDASKSDDPVVCIKDRSFATGSHMRQPKVCKLKSEWAFEVRQTQRKLQSVKEKGTYPMPVTPPTQGSPE